jgi:Xaa-Pro aminopeptidase
MGLAEDERTALGARWQRIVTLLDERELDALYVTAGPNFRWLAGGSPYPGGLPIWLSALIISAGGSGLAVISDMHAEILDLDGTGIGDVITYADGDDTSKVLGRALSAAGITAGSRLGVEENIPFADTQAIHQVSPHIVLESAQSVFDRVRAVKDDVEIALLRRSGAAVDAAYEAARDTTRAGSTMADAGVAMYRAMIEAGSTQPHVSGSFRRYQERTLRAGDVLDIDIGADMSGYSVDTARNIFIGDPGAEMREQHEMLERSYAASASLVRPGVPVSAIHDACAGVLAEAGKRQTWKVGHGVGLAEGHEAPLLQPGNDTPLEAGMVFTIDPGYFLRLNEPLHIEETVLVTDDGCERMTRFPLGILVV